ncbi:hypothetical protein SRABI133_01792 [Peribacillus simplex]|uniref:HTH lysR-type domain-containing protein n=1 Tax=Peribacillus simplex TaxID=1478 RepID=A0A9W4KVU8_9BACI|nr:hypothetical protein SRABI133_01792 [Peribacillus simplex]
MLLIFACEKPNLSRVKDLEQELRKNLFIRSSHSIILTDEGMLQRKGAEEIVNMVDKLGVEFSSMEETISGEVYVGGGETDAMIECSANLFTTGYKKDIV